MISVLASIRPFWSRKILAREKTVEIRRTAPRAANGEPFRVYLYETRPGAAAVVGEVICFFTEKAKTRPYNAMMVQGSCLSLEEIKEYAKGKAFWGWHIFNVVEYQEPVPLERFGLTRAPQSWCYVKEDAA